MLEPSLELARRMEGADVQLGRALVRSFEALFPRQPSLYIELGGGALYAAGGESRVAQVVGIGLQGPVSEGDLDRLGEWLEQRGLPAEVQVCEFAEPTLVPRLRERGFQAVGEELALAREVLASDRAWVPPSGFAIHGLHPGEAGLWARLVARGFVSESEPAAILDPLVANVAADGFLGFLARAENTVIGAAGMQVLGDVACMFGHVTDERFRGRGVQLALLGHGLAVAAERGMTLAKLNTQPGSSSMRNAQRAGFERMYARTVFERGAR